MDNILSWLFFAIVFFVMMRFGCGAHMRHGHKGSAEHSDEHSMDHGDDNLSPQKHKDPVCGMEVDIEQGYGKMHEGQLYRFCSRDCLDKFELGPEQYVTINLTHAKHKHEGGTL